MKDAVVDRNSEKHVILHTPIKCLYQLIHYYSKETPGAVACPQEIRRTNFSANAISWCVGFIYLFLACGGIAEFLDLGQDHIVSNALGLVERLGALDNDWYMPAKLFLNVPDV